MTYHGDISLGDTIDFQFNTFRFSTGAPFTLAGTPTLAAYVGNSVTEITAGLTLTVDFDAKTGLHNVRVVATSGNGYTAGTDVTVVLAAGTVDSVSVANAIVGSFSIDKRSALRPTTANRTLDVTATGAAGIDWANVENPTTALNLSATNIDVDQVVASVSGAVGSVTGTVTLAAVTHTGAVIPTVTTLTGHTAQTGDSYARLGAPAGASVSADIAAVKSETASIQSDTNDIQTRLPAALTGAGNMKSDALAINGNTTSAAVLAILNGNTVVYQGTVTGAATTTTLIDSGLTQADTDWWKGRIIIFTSVITLQATDITAFDPATDKLTFTAVTSAPTGASYVII